MKIEISSRREMQEVERKQVDAWVAQIFADEADNLVWSSDDWYVSVKLDGQMVSHVGIVERTGTVDGQPVKLGGIGGVATRPDWRRHGYAGAALRTAAEFMRNELRVEFGLLVCGDQMMPYYGKLGWQLVAGPLMFDQPKGKTTFGDSTKVMVLPCNKHDWPPGVIDLCGPPW
jgi:aminoglycoside 2'-N-acetyltransferase I